MDGFLRGSMMVDAKQRARRALGVARRAEHAAFEPVERAVGGEEGEAAFVARDDAGGAVMNSDDVGFGHDASFAAIAARVQKQLKKLRELRRDQRQAPVAAETQRRVRRLRISPTAGFGFDLMRRPGK
jgi:hypothetical protein